VGLHDRLSRSTAVNGAVAEATAPTAAQDPYADLKAQVHHACIAKLGPELFNNNPQDLNDAVYRAVTEELAITDTPLTREEHNAAMVAFTAQRRRAPA